MIIIPEHIIHDELENLIKYVWTNYKSWKGVGTVIGNDFGATGFTGGIVTAGSVGVSQVATIQTVADISSALHGQAFTINTPSSNWYVWLDTGVTAVSPSVNDKIIVRVPIEEDDDADTVATKIALVLNSYPLWWSATVIGDTITLTCVEIDARRRSLLFAFFGNREFGRYKYFDKMVKILEDKYNAKKRPLQIFVGYNPMQKTYPTLSILLPSDEHNPRRATMVSGVHNYNSQGGDVNNPIINRSLEKSAMYTSTYDLMISSNDENEVIVIYQFLKTLMLSGVGQLQHSGLQNVSISGRDVMLDFDIDPQTMYHRTIGLNFHYDNSVPELKDWQVPDTLNFNGTVVNVGAVQALQGVGFVRNTEDVLLGVVMVGEWLTLSNILFTDSDGVVTPVPVGENIVATLCPTQDVDIEIDSSFLETVSGGGTHNQGVVDVDGNQIGTVANPSVVASSLISIDGTPLKTLLAEQPHNIKIVDSGLNLVPSVLIGDDTVQVPDPAASIVDPSSFADANALFLGDRGLTFVNGELDVWENQGSDGTDASAAASMNRIGVCSGLGAYGYRSFQPWNDYLFYNTGMNTGAVTGFTLEYIISMLNNFNPNRIGVSVGNVNSNEIPILTWMGSSGLQITQRVAGISTTTYWNLTATGIKAGVPFAATIVYDATQAINADKLKCYINGVFVASTTTPTHPSSVSNGSGRVELTSSHTSFSSYCEMGGYVGYWERALSLAEIAENQTWKEQIWDVSP